tara:strand:- start:8801 stop:10018 length:1218 start_codon:yes stop_codon:yes gene_type:complete
MISKDLLKYSLHALWQRKLRSVLTIISIFIGITAIFTLVSFGQGLSSYVEDIAEQMGTDKLIIQPRGFGFGGPPLDSNVRLDKRDSDFVEKVNGVSEATGMYVLSGEIEFEDVKKFAYTFGSDFKEHRKLIDELYTLKIEQGKPLRGKEKTKIVLGNNYLYPDKVFARGMRVGEKVKLNGIKMEVIGFYEKMGNPVDDRNIYMTDKAAEELFEVKDYQFILVRAAPGKNPTQLAETIQEKLRKHRNQRSGQEDFQVQTFEQLLETFTSVLNIINVVLILIALISIFVAAVNIMNTMYTSVLERTKEIGVMKAIGARNSDILFVFVLESGLLGLLGGILGVLAGYSIALYGGKIVLQAGFGILQPIFTWQLIVGCLLFAFVIGLLSGLLPARRASKLNPVDALQYE